MPPAALCLRKRKRGSKRLFHHMPSGGFQQKVAAHAIIAALSLFEGFCHMKPMLLAAALALTLPMGAAQAQSAGAAKKPAAASAKKAPAKKATAKKKSASAKRRVPAKTAKAVEKVTPVQSLTQRLTPAELAIAQYIHTGRIQCALGANVTVTADEKNPGFFHVSAGKQRYYMHPVESRTGAIRLEDNRAGAMWLQLGNKSMLMDQKRGQRVADECAAPAQREFAAQLGNQPKEGSLLGQP